MVVGCYRRMALAPGIPVNSPGGTPPLECGPGGLNCDRPPDTKGGVGGARGRFCVRPKAAAVGHELAAWPYAVVEVPVCVSGYV